MGEFLQSYSLMNVSAAIKAEIDKALNHFREAVKLDPQFVAAYVAIDKRGISVIELSKTSGVSYATLKRFFSADHDISSKKLCAVLSALEVDLVSLVSKGFASETSHKELPSYLKKSLTRFIQGVHFGA